MSVKLRRAGQEISIENIIFRMTRTSSVEAISAGFYVTKVCQVDLGATVGGPMAREIEGKAVVGASVLAVLILLIVGASPLILGAGGTAGALLGVVGAAGVSMGAAAAVAGKSSSWVTWENRPHGSSLTLLMLVFRYLLHTFLPRQIFIEIPRCSLLY